MSTQIRGMIAIIIVSILTVFILTMLVGCEQIVRRPPLRTDIMRGQAETQHALARTLNAHAAIAENYALCTEAKQPKGIESQATNKQDCGVYPTSPVTANVTDSNKRGEKAMVQMLPNPASILLGPFGMGGSE